MPEIANLNGLDQESWPVTRTGQIWQGKPVFEDTKGRRYIVQFASGRPIGVFFGEQPNANRYILIDGKEYAYASISRKHMYYCGDPEYQYDLTPEEKAAHAA